MSKHRRERINAEIKRVLSNIFLVDLPVQQNNIVSVLKVETSKDLEEAKVYISVLKDRQEVLEKLNEAIPYIRHLLGQKMKLRKIPKLHFILVDDTHFIV